MWHPVDADQHRLAVTLGLLLLVAGVILLHQLAGPLVAFVLAAGFVQVHMTLPWAMRRLAVRRARRRLRNG